MIELTCFLTEHKLWFLEGDSPCEGRVKGETDGYLQTISKERAAEVCTQNHCGSLISSSVCPENTTSTNCSMKNTIISPTPQFVYVKCSGTYSSFFFFSFHFFPLNEIKTQSRYSIMHRKTTVDYTSSSYNPEGIIVGKIFRSLWVQYTFL